MGKKKEPSNARGGKKGKKQVSSSFCDIGGEVNNRGGKGQLVIYYDGRGGGKGGVFRPCLGEREEKNARTCEKKKEVEFHLHHLVMGGGKGGEGKGEVTPSLPQERGNVRKSRIVFQAIGEEKRRGKETSCRLDPKGGG